MKPIKILLVDDHVLVRKGFASLLSKQKEFQVVGDAVNGLEAIQQARKFKPDIILMDVHMSECDGPHATRIIKQEMPDIKVIMLTVSDDDKDLFNAIKSGARGYLLKNIEPEKLFETLKKHQSGEPILSPGMMARILDEFQQDEDSISDKERLTVREKQVLQHVVLGESNRQISETLFITEHTVKIHLRNILEKLHLKNRVQAAVYAVQEGVVDSP